MEDAIVKRTGDDSELLTQQPELLAMGSPNPPMSWETLESTSEVFEGFLHGLQTFLQSTNRQDYPTYVSDNPMEIEDSTFNASQGVRTKIRITLPF